MKKAKIEKNKMKTNKSGQPIITSHPILCLATALLILFQIIWNFYMHEPYRQTDITMETVQTIMQEGFSYQTNPMTGMPYTQGAPTRWKLLVLPYFYAGICSLTGIQPHTLIYEWVPMIVLILSYAVYAGFAGYLFPADSKKQCIFILIVALLYQFGDFAPVTDSFRLFHTGYEGTAIRAAVLLPLALLSSLKGRWWLAAVCAFVEAAIVWTLYGMGYTVLIILGVAAVKAASGLYEKRRKTV